MAKGNKVKVVKGEWAGLTGEVREVNGNKVLLAPDTNLELVGTFTLDQIELR